MTIEEFKILSDDEKEKTIWNCANFVIEFEAGNKRCDVYQLDDFYIGVFYEIRQNVKAMIKAVMSPEELPYM